MYGEKSAQVESVFGGLFFQIRCLIAYLLPFLVWSIGNRMAFTHTHTHIYIYVCVCQRTEKNADTRRSRSRNTNQGSQNSSGSKQPHRAVTAIYRPLSNSLITVVKGTHFKHKPEILSYQPV